MKITSTMLTTKLYELAQNNAPVRKIVDKHGRPIVDKHGQPIIRAVGKKGTNMYSPYPGNLKNNGIHMIGSAVVFDYNKVGYIGYANLYSHSPRFIEKTLEDFLNYCVSLGGRIVTR